MSIQTKNKENDDNVHQSEQINLIDTAEDDDDLQMFQPPVYGISDKPKILSTPYKQDEGVKIINHDKQIVNLDEI